MKRLLCVVMLLATAGCAQTPYINGRTTKDLPAQVDTIKLDKVVAVDHFPPFFADPADPEELVDRQPNPQQLTIAAEISNVFAETFHRNGIMLINGDTKQPLQLRIYFQYADIFISRGLSMKVYICDANGAPLMRFNESHYPKDLLEMALFTKERMLQMAASSVAGKTMGELRKRQTPSP
ncbi:MAG: hypothetical protein H7Z12_20400 [Rhodospirillaceae bacterium]|nr:hypothetical protein [Rhodospirillales bacterium]